MPSSDLKITKQDKLKNPASVPAKRKETIAVNSAREMYFGARDAPRVVSALYSVHICHAKTGRIVNIARTRLISYFV